MRIEATSQYDSDSIIKSALIQYPEYIPNPTVMGFYPKVSYAEAVSIYDEFNSLGMELLPKIRSRKVPLAKYWKKGSVRITPQTAKQEQFRADVSGWCVRTGDIVVIDIDNYKLELGGLDPMDVYYEIMGKSNSNFIFSTPTGGIHIYYRLPENFNVPVNNGTLYDGVDVRGKGGQVVFYGSYSRYDGKYAKQKGVVSGHLGKYLKVAGAKYDFIPYMSKELYDWILNSTKVSHISEGEIYGLSDEGTSKIDKFESESFINREDVVLELCEVILDKWNNNKNYSEWCQFWMSAHVGSDGSSKVKDYILEHNNIYWVDGNKGKQQFFKAWDTYVSSNKLFYTIASLFYLARNSGWLTKTGYEIPSDIVDYIDCDYISEWFDDLDIIPSRLLLESQTGSGKTFVFSSLWRKVGKPKSVIFCPSIKLSIEMANTLIYEHRLPVTLYKDDSTGETINVNDMLDAKILVTTLQTFALKLYNRGISMEDYGLVYFEESDQLLSQFSRGGGGEYSTHVTEIEAQLGFKLIRESLLKSNYVWFVDATMTQVTYKFVKGLVDDGDFGVIRNMRISKKPVVEFVGDKKLAYKAIIDSLVIGKKVVIACDTKNEAFYVQKMLEFLKLLDNIKWVVITRDTAKDAKVLDFMQDVNKGAKEYDLVIYNSSMGSGVSITSTIPDIIIQLCTYLPPRINLQIINRYRKQSKVICYYSDYENIYGVNSKTVIKIVSKRVFNELSLIELPFTERTELAKLRSEIASISIADENIQRRNPKIFYQSLLHNDGRDVIDYKDKTSKIDIDSVIKHVKELRDSDKEMVKNNWRTVDPIDTLRPAKLEYSFIQVAYGLIHAKIEKTFDGKVPNNDLVDDKELYRLSNMFYSARYVLSKLLKGGGGLSYYERYLTNKNKALVAYWYDLSIMKLFSIVNKYFWEDISKDLEYKEIINNSSNFIDTLESNKKIYDGLFRKRQQYDSIMGKDVSVDKKCLSFSKNILTLVGLKQRLVDKNKKTYKIINYEDVVMFFRLKEFEGDLVFNMDYIQEQVIERAEERKVFDILATDIKDEVLTLLSEERGMSFRAAVNLIHSGEELV